MLNSPMMGLTYMYTTCTKYLTLLFNIYGKRFNFSLRYTFTDFTRESINISFTHSVEQAYVAPFRYSFPLSLLY
jgi:hypothetical protein